MTTQPSTASALDVRLDEIRRDLVDRLWWAFFLLTLLSVGVNLWRIADTGWSPYFVANVSIAGLFIATFLGRRRLSYRTKSIIAVSLFFVVGLSGLINFGMTGAGFFWMVQSALMAGVLFSVRTGLIAMALSTLLLGVVGYAYVTGAMKPALDLNAISGLPSTWLHFVVSASVIPAVLLYTLTRFQNTIQNLLFDVQDQRDALEKMATHDNLTGLPVMHLAADHLQLAFSSARRSGHKVALLFIDLDGFKAVNDSLGHDAGDAVLKAIATRLREGIRAEDTPARIGGDEFVVVLTNLTQANDAAPVAEKLISEIARPVEFDGKELRVGASIGIAVFPDHATDIEALRKEADEAMYRVKKSGKNAFAFAGDGSPPVSAVVER